MKEKSAKLDKLENQLQEANKLIKKGEADAEKKLQALEDEAQNKILASEVEAKKLFLDQEKSLKEAADKLIKQENQLQALKMLVEKPSLLRALETAIKSVRKTGMYGYDASENI
jgi:hypothetical protein